VVVIGTIFFGKIILGIFKPSLLSNRIPLKNQPVKSHVKIIFSDAT